MFCRICGKKINDNAKFCPYCGQRVDGLIYVPSAEKKKESTSFDKVKKIIFLFLIICIIVPVGLFAIEQIESNRINPYEELVVYFEGNNGEGVVRYEYPNDYDPFGFLKDKMTQLQEKYNDYLFNGSLNDWQKMNKVMVEYQNLNELLNSITMEISKQSELSNGDEIVVKYLWNDEIAKSLGYKLKSEKTYIVSGLNETES